jgi:PhnB protein
MPMRKIPDGYHTVTPYLMIAGAQRFIDFMAAAFDARVTEQMRRPDGRIGHTEIRVGDSVIMLSEAMDAYPATPVMLYLYLEDADAAFERALRAGASEVQKPANQFYGDRTAAVKDPTGTVTLYMATRVEDVSPDELKRRAAAAMQQQQ